MDHKKKKKILGFCIVVILSFFVNGMNKVGFCQPPMNKVNLHIKTADALVEKMTEESLGKAIEGYEKALEINSENYEAFWKIATAYVYIIDIITDAFIVEKDEYKPILKDMGGVAERYAKKAYEINPKGKEAVTAYLRAYGYHSASFGIVKAIFKGAAGHYKKLAKELIVIDDTYEGGLGYSMLGALYYKAPWPVGSSKKAKKYYQKTLKINNKSLSNHYWLGMIYLRKKEHDLAKKEFEFVINNPPTETEKHFISKYKKEAEKQLGKILEKKETENERSK